MLWNKWKKWVNGILVSQPVMGKKLPWINQRWWLPMERSLKSCVNVKRCNRFLLHQEKRILKLIEKGESNKALQCWRALAKRSVSFQLASLIKTYPRWYRELKLGHVWRMLKMLRKDMLKSDWKIDIRRVYLKKPTLEVITDITEFYKENPSGRLRPIGVPQGHSRIKSTMVLDVLNLFNLTTIKWQHAYYPRVGVHSAICALWKKKKKKTRKRERVNVKNKGQPKNLW